jgi:hypothetical protein
LGTLGTSSPSSLPIAEKTVNGKINLYSSATPNTNFNSSSGYSGTNYRAGRFGTTYAGPSPLAVAMAKQNFYNFGYGPVKVANYKNLSLDLVSNSESMALLSKYKKTNRNQNIFFAATTLSTLTAMILVLLPKNNETSGFPPASYVFMGASVGFGITTFVLANKKSKYLKASIESYNGF